VSKRIETIKHEETRLNVPTAELDPFMPDDMRSPVQVTFERRNRDLDPQLMWRGKDDQDKTDLVVPAPPLYVQDKVHPKVIIDDLKKDSDRRREESAGEYPDLFGDFNGLPDEQARTEFYQHSQHWSNRMILGDSLQVMASLTEREDLRGKVQCIYFDPPYGIKFNSNFQWSTGSRDVKDGKADHITREPEMVKAFRDTWADGIHSYLTYLRDRLTVARDLLTESGSIFVQIGDENVHRVRALMDEVFGEENLVSEIIYRRGGFQTGAAIANTFDYILWFARNKDSVKTRWVASQLDQNEWYQAGDKFYYSPNGTRRVADGPPKQNEILHSDRACISATGSETSQFPVQIGADAYTPPKGRGWSTGSEGMGRLIKADRIFIKGRTPRFAPHYTDWPFASLTNAWMDLIRGGFSSSGADDKIYVVQTQTRIVERCISMTTDPGDLVLDPTCGSGTTAYVAEQWGRRWITIDTSRVALALARARIMGARYPWYLLADSREGQVKEGEITRTPPRDTPTQGRIRQGFVYKRVPHITLKSIANNAEIDTIWEEYQEKLEPLRAEINAMRGRDGSDLDLPPFEEWTMPREPGAPWPNKAAQALEKARNENASNATRTKWLNTLNEEMGRDYTLDTLPEHPVDPWNDLRAEELHAKWWKLRIERQQEIDASIAAKADTEYLYDQPYEDKSRVRVAGPFTVESLSPHRMKAVGPDGEYFDPGSTATDADQGETPSFSERILKNLESSGIQQIDRSERLKVATIEAWPGEFISAKASLEKGDRKQRAGILVGPEYGTVGRREITRAAIEAAELGMETLIVCAFNYDAQATGMDRYGTVNILRARMNADLHMLDLKNTGAGNLFVVYGEPDIAIEESADGSLIVEVRGVDVYRPTTGKVESSSPDDIALWLVDTDYDDQSFFVRHAYFLGANSDPYKALKSTLKAEVDEEAWATLRSSKSRPFPKPIGGRIAVKVINHLGDEVMKVMNVD
tara:strand:- start:4428 stop:7370 length:2943 start_codon:yes stop_codon:yes gene_type:complete